MYSFSIFLKFQVKKISLIWRTKLKSASERMKTRKQTKVLKNHWKNQHRTVSMKQQLLPMAWTIHQPNWLHAKSILYSFLFYTFNPKVKKQIRKQQPKFISSLALWHFLPGTNAITTKNQSKEKEKQEHLHNNNDICANYAN